jgi:hypothetical protein
VTALDRDDWSYQRCDHCHARRAQLIIDRKPRSDTGWYVRLCWQCYWLPDRQWWKQGPIVNCGAMWDHIDDRRALERQEAANKLSQ